MDYLTHCAWCMERLTRDGYIEVYSPRVGRVVRIHDWCRNAAGDARLADALGVASPPRKPGPEMR